jgi:hypothetical protein
MLRFMVLEAFSSATTYSRAFEGCRLVTGVLNFVVTCLTLGLRTVVIYDA